MLEGKVINPDSGRWEGVSTHSRETEALKRERSDQSAPSIADQDATPRDLDLDMLRDLCSSIDSNVQRGREDSLRKESLAALKRSGVVVAR